MVLPDTMRSRLYKKFGKAKQAAIKTGINHSIHVACMFFLALV